jgi:hypothetical protein
LTQNGLSELQVAPKALFSLTWKSANVSYRTMVGAFLDGSAPNVVVVADPAIITVPPGWLPQGSLIRTAYNSLRAWWVAHQIRQRRYNCVVAEEAKMRV